MAVISVLVVGSYLMLWITAEVQQRHCGQELKEHAGVMRPFRRIAGWYLQKKQRVTLKPSGRSAQGFVSRRVLEDLYRLNGERTDNRTAESYYIDKLALSLAIVFAGTLLCAAVSLQAQTQGRLTADGRLRRGDYRQEKAAVILEPAAEGVLLEPIALELSGRIPEEGEIVALEEEFWTVLCETVLGENLSTQEIRSSLNLCTGLAGYPFTVKWQSPDPLLVGEDGTVRALREEEGSLAVVLHAQVGYETWTWQHDLELVVCPPLLTEEERLQRELEEYLTQQEALSRREEYLELPADWQDATLTWKERQEDYGLLFWMLTMLTAGAVFCLKDRDLHARVAEQQKRMKGAYPAFCQKLLLYLGAGLTVRSTFERMAREYQRNLQQGGEKLPVYEEVLRTCRELHTGVPESVAYEHFGNRCGTQEYIRLGAQLSRNLKKGNSMLGDRLREECDAAVRERFHRSRQLGEEASTKLLLPMMLMLGIVMIVIMIPAFGAM